MYKNDVRMMYAEVRHILDTVVQNLQQNHERKFSYVETAFFFRWWNEQSDQIKKNVRVRNIMGREPCVFISDQSECTVIL